MKVNNKQLRNLIIESIKTCLFESDSYDNLPNYDSAESARDAMSNLDSNPVMQKEIIRSTLAFANNFGLKKIKSYGAGSDIFFDKNDTWEQGERMASYWNHVHKNQPKISGTEAQSAISEKLVKKSLKRIQQNLELMAKLQKDFNYDTLVSLRTPHNILKSVILVQYDSILKEYENKIISQKSVNFETLVSWYIMNKLKRDLESNLKNLSYTIRMSVKHRMFKQIQSKVTKDPEKFKREDFFVIHYIGAFAGGNNVFDRATSFIPEYAGKVNKNEETGVLYHKSVKSLSDSLGIAGGIGVIINGYITAAYSGDIRSTRYDTTHGLKGGSGIGGFVGREQTGFARYAGDGAGGSMVSAKNAVLDPNQLVKDGKLFEGGYTETFFDNWKIGGLICNWQKVFSDTSSSLGHNMRSSLQSFQEVINQYKVPLYDQNFKLITLSDINKILGKTLPNRIKNK
jgi:hypothetical protein